MQKGKKFLSDLKLYSDYFKWNENTNRYENWEEACEDIMQTHINKYGDKVLPYADLALQSMKDKAVLASQRTLQYRGEQIEKHNTRLYNCTSTYLARNRAFQEIFYLMLSGCGVGVGVLKPFVANLSKIQKRTLGTKTFVIPDSIEGWADSLGVLMSSYFVDEQPFPEYAGYEIKFDYSLIREKGAFISGGFKAPGPKGLRNSLNRIEELINKWIASEGEIIRPILGFDILCHISNAVLSGGVRRSAMNLIVDPYDDEMINAKIGDWFNTHPHRARSNNSVILLRGLVTKERFEELIKMNEGMSDIGFVFANSWFDMFNPCFEISKIPMLWQGDFESIKYEEIEQFTREHKHLMGIQGCNLTEINAEKCNTREKFYKACADASTIGTFQAGWTSFPYLGEITESIFKREALLGVSVTGWMNNPKLFNATVLKEGANIVKDTNKKVAELIGINPAARTTCVKPSGNASVILGTASGIHPEHSERYFRIMQLSKETDTAKWLEQNMPFLLEESVYSETKSDYVVFVPIENPRDGVYKKDLGALEHLELIKLVQENWVNEGTDRELSVYPNISHNVSCTVIVGEEEKNSVVDYIWDHKDSFNAVSFISQFGDKDFNQAPFTSVETMETIINEYGKGALFASGMIVDGLHYFKGNLWHACDSVMNKSVPISGTREDVLLKKYWIDRAKKFARNYFRGDTKKMVNCLKDIHLLHKWEVVNRQMREVDFNKILEKPTFKDVNEYAAQACSGGSCEITKI